MLGQLNGYEVSGLIGQGTMGAVLRAADVALNRTVAIKAMLPHLAETPSARARFLQEGRAIANLSHENIVTVHAVGELNNIPYLVLEFVGGGTLADRLEKQAPLPLPQLIRIGLDIASGLSAAHSRGLVHRDVKPANLLLEERTGRVKIADFGLVQDGRLAEPDATEGLTGTPLFMSPEQADGQRTDPRSDMFSLGVILYLACTGKMPFNGESVQDVLQAIRETSPPPVRALNPALPAWLEEVVAGLLTKKANLRYPTAGELKRLLLCHWAKLVMSGDRSAVGQR
jgi:serine/threonine-protein kinase